MLDFPPTTLSDLRVNGDLAELLEANAPADPRHLFQEWLQDAIAHHLPEPNAMTLATMGRDGAPTARAMLLKVLDRRGFQFFTKYDSRKGHELAANLRAAAVFLWTGRHRQVSVRGVVAKLSREEAEACFANRPYAHQIGAWVSSQSTVIPGRGWLEAREAEIRARFFEGQVPCPPNWGGYVLQPDEFEFWQGRASRLHDRLLYTRPEGLWKIERLSP